MSDAPRPPEESAVASVIDNRGMLCANRGQGPHVLKISRYTYNPAVTIPRWCLGKSVAAKGGIPW